ncbi:MAG: hypothetical protein QM477_01540 [Planctomycetota bacterium]
MNAITHLLAGAALTLVVSSPATAQVSGTMPSFEGATWYNTPALSMEDMEGRAVMVEVFRTW